MKKLYPFLALIFFLSSAIGSLAQPANTWTQKANFGGFGRWLAVGFSIGHKGFIGTGQDLNNNYRKDFWEYDTVTNTWSQKADFGGTPRYGAVGFSIGAYGYLGTGYDTGSYIWSDFWKYDTTANNWAQVAPFGGTPRYVAVGFSIGNKGYIGTGNDNTLRRDFWKYDPSTDTWTEVASFGGSGREIAIAFGVGGDGFIGTGLDTSLFFVSDFWKYDTTTNAWTQKTDYPGGPIGYAKGMTIGTKGYAGTGYDGTFFRIDFYQYDPVADSWTEEANYAGAGYQSVAAFGTATKGYFGTGYGVAGFADDLWEYSPCVAPTAPTNTTPPANLTICSGNSTTLSVSGTGTFGWYSAATGGLYLGGGSNYTTPILIANTTYYVQDSTCTASITRTSITVTVNPTSAVSVSITASSNPVCAGTSVTFTATPVNGGTTPAYQWKVNGLSVGPNSPTYSYIPLNNDAVKCVLTSNVTCPTGNPATSNTITMTVNATSPVSVSITADNNPICSGTTVTFTATPTNGGGSPSYQWKVNGLPVGPNSPTYSYIPLNNDAVTCVLTSNIACPTGNPATSNTITMTVNATSPVSVSITADNNPVCSGTTVTFTATPVNGGAAPSYQWKVNGVNAGTNSPTYSYIPLNNDAVTCVLTSNIACPTGNPATSNTITMTVSGALPVSVLIAASENPTCTGTTITYTATPTNGGPGPSYQWKVNGVNAGTDSPTYSYIPVNNDVVTCVLTSNISCPSGNPATSNTITMTVTGALPVSVSITASANPSCIGSSVTYTATPTNGGAAPSYQWQVNGVNAGTDSPTYTYTPVNSDAVICVLTSSSTCATGNPATSNTITMTVNATSPVSVSITADNNPVCSGTSVTFTATPVNGGAAPSYQWQVNGINAGTDSPTYTYIPLNNDAVTCVLTSNVACPAGNPATSNTITMSVSGTLAVSVSIVASANPTCTGSSVTFTATPTNGGTTPSYQWKVNGINAGTDSPTYSYIPLNNDAVTCVLTSNVACPAGNPATSNTITMSVSGALAVSVSIVASANPTCTGSSVTFTATPANGGASPSYQWKVNGVNAGIDSPTYSYIPLNNDAVTCVLTSSIGCSTGNPATSNQINMVVNNGLPAGVSITASSNPFCPGSSVTFTATPVNGGASPSYQWKVDGVNAGINSATYTYNPVNNDSVRCIMTSDLACVSGNPASSADIIMNGAGGSLIVTFTSCFDTITSVNAQPIKLKGGIPLGGTYSGPGVNPLTGIFTQSIAGTGTKTITYTYTNAAMCTASKSIHIIVQGAPVFSCGDNLIDIRDNKSYTTVQLGSQCWMASNLNYGTTLVSAQDQRDNCSWEKYCYNDNPANCTSLGGLYQWDELMQYDNTPGAQGFCPPGWHIPADNEWNTLFADYVNSAFAGSPLKYSGYSGYDALLSGENYFNNSWVYKGFSTFFWSSTFRSNTQAWAHGMNAEDPSVSHYPAARINAFAVRCLQD